MLFALAVAIVLRAVVVQVFFIPSSSMVPTLAVDDRILVEKVTYRFREPARGDLVVFAGLSPVRRDVPEQEQRTAARVVERLGTAIGLVPPDPSDLVKRLIGLPGDEIAVIDGLLHINGVPHGEDYLSGPVASDFGPVRVPDGALFFLGDNRRNSADSRGSLGFVDRERVIGRAVAIVWPPGSTTTLLGQRPVPLGPTSSVG